MKNWLDNVTDEQIIEFTKRKLVCDCVEVKRKKDIIEVKCTSSRPLDTADELEYISYYNAFGPGLIYANKFMLNKYGPESKQWFDVVFRANKDVVLDGLTYLEAFEQAHEYSLIDAKNRSNKLLEENINKLKHKQNQNEIILQNDLHSLHNDINSIRHIYKHKNSNPNLLVKAFLTQMSLEERCRWLKDNGLSPKPDKINSSCPIVSRNLFK